LRKSWRIGREDYVREMFTRHEKGFRGAVGRRRRGRVM
jgi:hypothetical protein